MEWLSDEASASEQSEGSSEESIEDDDTLACEDRQDPLEIELPQGAANSPNMTYPDGIPDDLRHCNEYGKTFSKTGYPRHLMVHFGEKPFKCPHCSDQFVTEWNLQSHVINKHRIILFADCKNYLAGSSKITDEDFEDAIAMLFEETRRSTGQGYGCNYCTKSFGRMHRSQCEFHMMHVHLDELKTHLNNILTRGDFVKKPAVKEMLGTIPIPPNCQQCSDCGKVVLKKKLMRHLSVHAGEEPFSCRYCSQRFRSNGDLRISKFARHCDIAFADCKGPTVSAEQLESGIAQMFEDIKNETKGKLGCYPCPFCNREAFHQRRDSEVHMIQAHLDLLKCQLREILRRNQDASSRLQNAGESGTVPKEGIWKGRLGHKYDCAYCGRKCLNQHKHGAHLVGNHRFEVFGKYFPPGTTPHQLNFVIKKILEQVRGMAIKGNFNCHFPNCQLKFSRLGNYEIHILVAHFDEVVSKIKDHLPNETSELKGDGVQMPPGFEVKREPQSDQQLSAIRVLKTEQLDLGESPIKRETMEEEESEMILP